MLVTKVSIHQILLVNRNCLFHENFHLKMQPGNNAFRQYFIWQSTSKTSKKKQRIYTRHLNLPRSKQIHPTSNATRVENCEINKHIHHLRPRSGTKNSQNQNQATQIHFQVPTTSQNTVLYFLFSKKKRSSRPCLFARQQRI